jgi:hypothetical protein
VTVTHLLHVQHHLSLIDASGLVLVAKWQMIMGIPFLHVTVYSLCIVYHTDNSIDRQRHHVCTPKPLTPAQLTNRSSTLSVISQEIDSISLHNPIPIKARIYGLPFLSKLPLIICNAIANKAALYPLLYYTYYHKYDDWVVSEEWTFIYCVLLFAGHALTFLSTAWSTGINQRVGYTTVS